MRDMGVVSTDKLNTISQKQMDMLQTKKGYQERIQQLTRQQNGDLSGVATPNLVFDKRTPSAVSAVTS